MMIDKKHISYLGLTIVALILTGCGANVAASTASQRVPGGNADNGPSVMRRYGCVSCHVIPGVEGANGYVGPPLTDFGKREYIAGLLPNTGPNLEHWIMQPQSVVKGVDMPDMGVTRKDARDIAAYLEGLG